MAKVPPDPLWVASVVIVGETIKIFHLAGSALVSYGVLSSLWKTGGRGFWAALVFVAVSVWLVAVSIVSRGQLKFSINRWVEEATKLQDE